jgi:hypothetical protein
MREFTLKDILGSNSPVHEENGKWYFWDEAWADRYGPFDTEKECRDGLEMYCATLFNQEPV